jgi:hypothetical protein
MRRIANDALTQMDFQTPTLTLENTQTHVTMTHSFANDTTN